MSAFKLPEPVKEVYVAGYHDAEMREALEDYYTAEQVLAAFSQGCISVNLELLDALRQWQAAERDDDGYELSNAKCSRDAAIRKATGEQA